jgi:deazaflavin-dependent oxidoreductase (nitroreductase family)
MTEPHPATGIPSAPDFHSRRWRFGNAFVSVLARLGIGPIHLLTVVGRRTGRPRTHPVVPVDHDGRRWLVAPYGPVAWVQNARAAGRISLRYGRTTRDFTVREVSGEEAAPVLKRYVEVAGKTRNYFDATTDSPARDFAREADRHPVFELTPVAHERSAV